MLAPPADGARPRAAIDSDGLVEGYASLFGVLDQANDMMMPGAFAASLRHRGLRRIPMLFQHDPSEPIGVWLELREDWRGLYVRGRLIPEVMRARELLALLRAGTADGLSIGFRTVTGRIDPKTRIRRLYQVDLWEISLVTFPLLDGARLASAHKARRAGAARLSFSFPRRQGDAAAPSAPRARAAHTAPAFVRDRAEAEWRRLARRS